MLTYIYINSYIYMYLYQFIYWHLFTFILIHLYCLHVFISIFKSIYIYWYLSLHLFASIYLPTAIIATFASPRFIPPRYYLSSLWLIHNCIMIHIIILSHILSYYSGNLSLRITKFISTSFYSSYLRQPCTVSTCPKYADACDVITLE